MPALRVLQPGVHTTIQDLGRPGWQRFGVSVAGAMDPALLTLANRLAHNPAGHACLEWTLQAPVLQAEGDVLLAVAGDAVLVLDGERMPAWRSVRLEPGQILAIEAIGLRGYVAVQGGVQVPQVLGSRSTHVRSGLGGLEGRALRHDDRILLAEQPPGVEFACDPWPLPDTVRVLPGPHAHLWNAATLAQFYAHDWQVTARSDRMGMHLDGPPLASTGAQLLSEGTPWGTVQVPGDGKPLVLLADRQPTGGYPQIAVVIQADLGVLAQKRPGQTVRMQPVTQEQARESWRIHQKRLDSWLTRPAPPATARLLGLDLVGPGWLDDV